MVAIKRKKEGVDLMELDEDKKTGSLEINRDELFNFQEISEKDINDSLNGPTNNLEMTVLLLGMKFLLFFPVLLTIVFKELFS